MIPSYIENRICPTGRPIGFQDKVRDKLLRGSFLHRPDAAREQKNGYP